MLDLLRPTQLNGDKVEIDLLDLDLDLQYNSRTADQLNYITSWKVRLLDLTLLDLLRPTQLNQDKVEKISMYAAHVCRLDLRSKRDITQKYVI